jgi:hypothetical protein
MRCGMTNNRRTDSGKGELRGFFPIRYAEGQNDKRSTDLRSLSFVGGR